MIERVIATEVAESLIRGLRQRHGDVMFYLSHGCCDGSTPMCLKRGEMSLSEGDVQLGQVLGVPFHASRMQLDYLGDAQLTLDVRSGSLGTMSLEDADGLHFVIRSRKLSAAELADLSPVR